MKKYNIMLSSDDIVSLQNIIDDKKRSDREKQRAEILLLSDSNNSQPLTVSDISKKLNVSRTTVQSVRKDYDEIGIDAVKRKKRGTIRVCAKKPNIIEEAIIEYLDDRKQNNPNEICSVAIIQKELQAKGYIKGTSQASIYRVLKNNKIKLSDVNRNVIIEKTLLSTIKKLLGSRTYDFNTLIKSQSKLNSLCKKILHSKVFMTSLYIQDFPFYRMVLNINSLKIKIDYETQTIKYFIHFSYNKDTPIICSHCGKAIYVSDYPRLIECKNVNIANYLHTKNGTRIRDIHGLVPINKLFINAIAPYECPKCKHPNAVGFFFH